jgi:L-iditol 2-dehydrogenase
MKHTYPRAINLVAQKKLRLKDLVSHRFQLSDTPAAFALNTRYHDSVVKIMIRP